MAYLSPITNPDMQIIISGYVFMCDYVCTWKSEAVNYLVCKCFNLINC